MQVYPSTDRGNQAARDFSETCSRYRGAMFAPARWFLLPLSGMTTVRSGASTTRQRVLKSIRQAPEGSAGRRTGKPRRQGLVSGRKAGEPDDLKTQALCPEAAVRLPAARARQELYGVYGLVMPPQLEVEMRPGGPACIADVSDHVVAGNALARLDVELV